MEFSTTIKADFNNINSFLGINKDVDIEIETGEVIVKWIAEVDARDWGIKDISWTIQSVSGEIVWSIGPDELTAGDIEQIKAAGGTEYRNGNWEGKFELPQDWSIKDEIQLLSSCLCPIDVNVDCVKKEISVE